MTVVKTVYASQAHTVNRLKNNQEENFKNRTSGAKFSNIIGPYSPVINTGQCYTTTQQYNTTTQQHNNTTRKLNTV